MVFEPQISFFSCKFERWMQDWIGELTRSELRTIAETVFEMSMIEERLLPDLEAEFSYPLRKTEDWRWWLRKLAVGLMEASKAAPEVLAHVRVPKETESFFTCNINIVYDYGTHKEFLDWNFEPWTSEWHDTISLEERQQLAAQLRDLSVAPETDRDHIASKLDFPLKRVKDWQGWLFALADALAPPGKTT